MLGAALAAARRPVHDVRPLRRQGSRLYYPLLSTLDIFEFDLDNKWPELAADRLAWRAMLYTGQPPPAYRAPPTPNALRPAHCVHMAQACTLTATNAAIQKSVHQLAALLTPARVNTNSLGVGRIESFLF